MLVILIRGNSKFQVWLSSSANELKQNWCHGVSAGFNFFWMERPREWWCLHYNIYVYGAQCGICGSPLPLLIIITILWSRLDWETDWVKVTQQISRLSFNLSLLDFPEVPFKQQRMAHSAHSTSHFSVCCPLRLPLSFYYQLLLRRLCSLPVNCVVPLLLVQFPPPTGYLLLQCYPG